MYIPKLISPRNTNGFLLKNFEIILSSFEIAKTKGANTKANKPL
jgi:hypothetical protein